MKCSAKNLFILAATLVIAELLAATAGARGSKIGRFVSMVRLLAPLGRAAGSVRVEVTPDDVAGRVRLRCSGLPRSSLRSLVKQVEVAGGQAHASRRGKTVLLEIEFPFPNLQASWQVDTRKRILRLDIGSGRYLPPESPPVELAELLPTRFPGRESLLEAWGKVTAGKFIKAEQLLRPQLTGLGPRGQLACLLYADAAAYRNKLLLAGRRAQHCLERTLLSGGSLRSLAAMRVIAYGGSLLTGHTQEAVRQAAPSPVEYSWIYHWLLYERARLLTARGELREAMARLQALLNLSPQAVLERRGQRLLQRLVQARASHYPGSGEDGVDLAADSVDALAVLGAEWKGCGAVVEVTTRTLLDLDLPEQAANVTLWYLKNSPRGEDSRKLLGLLAEAFLDAGDSFRALKTLSFLADTAQVPNTLPDRLQVLLVRAQIRQGQSDEARRALAAVRNRRLLLGVAEEILQLRRPESDAELLELEQLLRQYGSQLKPERRAELTLLVADAAWAEGRLALARRLYQRFCSEFASDRRCSMAAHRLARLGAEPPSCRQVVEPWQRALSLLPPRVAQEVKHENSR